MLTLTSLLSMVWVIFSSGLIWHCTAIHICLEAMISRGRSQTQFFLLIYLKLIRMRYIPNVGHSMAGSDIWETILTFSVATLYNITLPTYTFSHNYAPEGAYVQLRIHNGVT